MTHFTASGGYRIKLQINYRSSVGQGSCVFVGGGGRVLQVLPVIPVRESHRASVSSFYGASSGNSNNVKQSYLPNL